MIWDCFTFHNEFEMLRLRCEELRPLGVRHVLVEATKTHSGFPKRLHFNERKAEFDDCNILHIIVKDMPLGWTYQAHWDREHFQRDAILKAPFDHDDTVLICDCDEIPRASAIKDWMGEMSHLVMDSYLYWLNAAKGLQDWSRARIMKGRWLNDHTPTYTRSTNGGQRVMNAGWHFSWMCGADLSRLATKTESFAHQELNLEQSKGQWPVNDGPFSPLDAWPKYLVNNQEQFANLIHPFPKSEPKARPPMRIHLKCKCGDEIEVEDVHMASVQDEAKRWQESHAGCKKPLWASSLSVKMVSPADGAGAEYSEFERARKESPTT